MRDKRGSSGVPAISAGWSRSDTSRNLATNRRRPGFVAESGARPMSMGDGDMDTTAAEDICEQAGVWPVRLTGAD